MKTLIVVPTKKERDFFLHAFSTIGFHPEESVLGKLSVVLFHSLGVTVANGGLGKVQFATQTQHLLDVSPDWGLVICAGAAGALVEELSTGDIIVATETIEHDIRSKFAEPLLPRFGSAKAVVTELRSKFSFTSVHFGFGPIASGSTFTSFRVRFGPIASGDEDIVDADRRREIQQLTGALAVAWEGAGGARACQFSGVPFVEIRGITDQADRHAASHFRTNLKTAMQNVAAMIAVWLAERTEI